MDSTLRHRVDGPAARDDVRTRRRERSTSASARGGASRVTAATRDIATRVIDISGARATIATFERRVDRVDVDAAHTIVTIGSRPRSGECARWHPARRGRCFGHGAIHHKLRGRYSWRVYGDKSGVYTSSVCVLKRTIDRHRARVFARENIPRIFEAIDRCVVHHILFVYTHDSVHRATDRLWIRISSGTNLWRIFFPTPVYLRVMTRKLYTARPTGCEKMLRGACVCAYS